jgi:hypothetical protein
MIIKLKNKQDFDHTVTYLQNQNYNFDRFNSQLFLKFSQESRCAQAVEELIGTQGIRPVA